MAQNLATDWTCIESPLGPLTVTASAEAVVALDWRGRPGTASAATPLLAEAVRQLETYFADGSFRFDLPLQPGGSDFQRAVWDFMLAIPAGKTRSYGDCAKTIDGTAGNDARAVGGACGANPIPVIIPCHRILAAGGDAGGYSGKGGLTTKRWLLRHEGAFVPPEQRSFLDALRPGLPGT